jgi:ATP-dependent RNA helicase RhlE
VYFVRQSDKRTLLREVLRDPALTRAIVFTRTKAGANRVTRDLNAAGVSADAIHGNKSQNARQNALTAFRNGKLRVLVATDIAARGIDVDDISHVINFEIPNEPESYVHRIGRTARAGARGVAISFCDASERTYLRDIERLTRTSLSVVSNHQFVMPRCPAGAGGWVARREGHHP